MNYKIRRRINSKIFLNKGCHDLKNAINQHKLLLLIIVTVFATLIGVWMLITPALTHARMLTEQNNLIKSIEEGDGQHHIESKKITPFYDEPGMDVVELSPNSSQSSIPHATELTDVAPSQQQEASGIGILSIDKISAKLPVTNGASDAQLQIAVGWVPQTAPIGSNGNAVIAGHRSYDYGVHFNRLGDLEAGDLIKYDGLDGEHMEFVVTELLTVEPGDPIAFAQPEDAQSSMLTLYTCTPIRTATHRLLVRAARTI